jgi:two-component system nitrate/nitrite response regulator NarL
MERRMATLKPSILFIDLALPRLGGLESLLAIQGLSSSTKILALFGTPDHKEEMLVLEAGVKGYCDKDMDHVLIKKAVQMVQKGEIWVERGIIPRLIKELADRKRQPGKHISSNPDRLNALTHRQQDIAFLISNGASNKAIAKALNITEATVKAHIYAIFRKLKVSDRLGLALFVREEFRLSS